MKRIIFILLSIIYVIILIGCSNNVTQDDSPSESSINTVESPTVSEDLNTQEQTEGSDTMESINIQVGNENFTAVLHDNESARTLVGEMPFTLEMDDYASQEKVTNLTFDLPFAQTQTPATINAGEIYLWSGNNLVLFYTTFSNSYSYVPIGYIEDVSGLQDALGSGNVSITFSTQ